MRVSCLLIGLLCLVATGVSAETNTRRFTRSSMSGQYLTVEAARNLGAGRYQAGFLGNFESQPAVFADEGKIVQTIVGTRLTLDAAFAFGTTDWLDLGVTLPLTLTQSGDGLGPDTPLTSSALGDPQLAARIRILDDRMTPWSLAAVVETWIPVHGEDTYVGHGGPGGSARLNMGYRATPRVNLALNVGYSIRPESDFGGARVDDEIAMGLGTHVRLGTNAIVAEGRLATDAFSPFGEPGGPAGEVNAAYRHTLGSQHGLTLGAGLGLLPGLGTPLWRSFIGYSLLGASAMTPPPPSSSDAGMLDPELGIHPTVVKPGDIDRDGILNANDQCPYLAEDRDGFVDFDGCPEPDNDLDNVLDPVDKAPQLPEDWDGNGDNDGAPELDNDGDGLADAADRCPSKPGAGDGCPGSPMDWRGELARQTREEPMTRAYRLGRALIPGSPIQFEAAEEVPTLGSASVIQGLADLIRKHPDLVRIEVGVHVRGHGNEAQDLWKSRLRAKALTKALVERGVDPLRLFPRGYGSTHRSWHADVHGVSHSSHTQLRGLLPFEASPKPGDLKKPKAGGTQRRKSRPSKAIDTFQPGAPIRFKPRTAELRAKSQAGLKELVEALNAHPTRVAEIAVHTSGIGQKAAMLKLSQARAETLVKALIAAGIRSERLTAKGYGGTMPKESPRTREGRAANRRVEIRWSSPARSNP